MRALFNKLLAPVACAMVLCAHPAAAESPWRVLELSGDVRIARPTEAPATAKKGDALPVGTSITTAGGARAKLSNDLQDITVGANSRMIIAPDSSTAMTRILQDAGSLLFRVDKRASPHFRVETPLLAAVVKGTTFTVSANPQGDMVAVAEGLVAVNPLNGGASLDVPGGSAAQILRSAPKDVVMAASAMSDLPKGVSLPPINYASASDGIVAGGPASPGQQTQAPAAALSVESETAAANTGAESGAAVTVASLRSASGASNGMLQSGAELSNSNIFIDAGGNLVINGAVVGALVNDAAGGVTVTASNPGANNAGGTVNTVGNVLNGLTDNHGGASGNSGGGNGSGNSGGGNGSSNSGGSNSGGSNANNSGSGNNGNGNGNGGGNGSNGNGNGSGGNNGNANGNLLAQVVNTAGGVVTNTGVPVNVNVDNNGNLSVNGVVLGLTGGLFGKKK